MTGKQKQELHAALLAAFPDTLALAKMVAFRLDENLEAIAGGSTLDNAVFKLILWAEARGRVEELIEKACEEQPDNASLRAVARHLTPPSAVGEPLATRFHDFHLRAWQLDDGHAQVMVHSSLAGSLRKPLTVASDLSQRDALCQLADKQWQGRRGTRRQITEMGRLLAPRLFPPAVSSLFVRSLERLAPDEGLRLRLCLDEALVDLPWEFLYAPELTGKDGLDGFLVLDTRVSLVREAPVACPKLPPLKQKQRLVFAGALKADGTDPWEVAAEYQSLEQALAPLAEFLVLEYSAAAGDGIEQLLSRPAAIFHYSGHTESHNGRGYLVREVRHLVPPGLPHFHDVDPLFSDRLDDLLRRAGTRLAVFSACYSGRWAFVSPLLQAGLAAVVGIQGGISSKAAGLFSERLYSALAVGLSLDEATIWARQSILDTEVSPGQESCEWGALMVYMPAADAVLLPRPEELEEVHRQQAAIRRERSRPGNSRR
ncbi:MAG TPA: effector-associated domain EAD1-containing protein [Gemmataceae bacterium]|nr:effector-associated domain EAD1-containing protein [Gemmataceae bacterium]